VAKPASVPWEAAGGLFVIGTTAVAAVRAVGAGPGDVVAVAGAAGGVGSLAAQLARLTGARVLGIAGSGDGAWLREHGIEPVDYAGDVATALRAASDHLDAFIDAAGHDSVALARELERRHPDLLTAAWWKEERGERVFLDFNQNAPHKTVFGAWSVRARPGAQVSTPVEWDEIPAIHPDDLTIASLPARLEARGDPWAEMDAHPQSLEPLLEMHERDRANGLHDAPWPPVYPKQPDEPPRVAPSRARKE